MGSSAPQVCALQWSRHEREILSSHGFSQNQLCLWKYPSMAKIAEFSARTTFPSLLTEAALHRGVAIRCPTQRSSCIVPRPCPAFRSTEPVTCRCSAFALQLSGVQRGYRQMHTFMRSQVYAGLQGHTARVLHMAQSPDGTTVVSAGADETLRFWKCFAEAPAVQKVPFPCCLSSHPPGPSTAPVQ